MESHEVVVLCLIFLAGSFSGAVYFVGIWKSIQRYQQSGNTALFVLGTFVRLAALLLFLWFVARNDITKYFVFLFGFILAKCIAIKISKRWKSAGNDTRKLIN